jgi:uncharacterized membrane protein HdeD (DUF308 family)
MRLQVFVFLWALLYVSSASAYVDPGTGMLMIQGLIALIAGVIAFMKNPWQGLKALLRRFRNKKDA